MAEQQRFLAPARSWPNWAPEPTGGFSGTVINENKLYLYAKMDSNGMEYKWPKHEGRRYVPYAKRTILPLDGSGFKIVDTKNRGKKVVTTKKVSRWTFVGVYPGRVYTKQQHKQYVKRHLLNDMYALDMFKLKYSRKGGGMRYLDTTFDIIDPSLGKDIDPMFAKAFPCRLNEPGKGAVSNCVFVYNLIDERIEVWTDIDIPANTELTICYGESYPRHWISSCSAATIQARAYIVKRDTNPIQRPGFVPIVKSNTVEWVRARANNNNNNNNNKNNNNNTNNNANRKRRLALNALLYIAQQESPNNNTKNIKKVNNTQPTKKRQKTPTKEMYVHPSKRFSHNVTFATNGSIVTGTQTIHPRDAHDKKMFEQLKQLPPKIRRIMTLAYLHIPKGQKIRPHHQNLNAVVNAVVGSQISGTALANALNIKYPKSGYRPNKPLHSNQLRHILKTYMENGKLPEKLMKNIGRQKHKWNVPMINQSQQGNKTNYWELLMSNAPSTVEQPTNEHKQFFENLPTHVLMKHRGVLGSIPGFSNALAARMPIFQRQNPSLPPKRGRNGKPL
jgi:hypothetical protein